MFSFVFDTLIVLCTRKKEVFLLFCGLVVVFVVAGGGGGGGGNLCLLEYFILLPKCQCYCINNYFIMPAPLITHSCQ